MARKKIKIDKDICIGCYSCVGLYPDDFMIGSDDLAKPITGEAEEEVLEVCPVCAISEEI